MPINTERLRTDFEAIGRITGTPGKGATRPTFTSWWGEAREYIVAAARGVGCRVWGDAFGNVHARMEGVVGRVWLCGSHVDTVPSGGDYDGVAGVLTALELLRSAKDDGVVLPLELIIFAEEEGPTFGLGMIGARAWVGELDERRLGELRNSVGESYLEAGKAFGVDPSRFAAERFDGSRYLGLIESHIEQGPGMWRRDERVAVVRAIAGRRQYRVVVHGEANHAGATSMGDRKDALAGAAEMVVGLESAVKDLSGDAVVTVGRMSVTPNAVNVIAERVEFTVDFRAPEDAVLERGDGRIRAVVDVLARERKLPYELVQTEAIPARPMDARLVAALRGGGLPVTVSGALHDSAVMSPFLPTVMVFVPSKGGISHNPAEFSRVEDVADATRLIEKLVRRPLLSAVSAMGREAFVAVAGVFYEHSPWIAERAWEGRPFRDLKHLAETMSRVVRAATADEQLGLIRAHPDLVGRLAREGKLTAESSREQAAAGLRELSAAEVERFEKFNAEYQGKFGFPFVICARENKKEAILAAFPGRLGNSVEAEVATALGEIDRIAWLRMNDAIWED